MSNSERRPRLYDKMAKDLDEHGALFIKHGETSQSLSLSDIFTLKDGSVTPVLKVKWELLLNRMLLDQMTQTLLFFSYLSLFGIVSLTVELKLRLYMDACSCCKEAVRNIFLPYCDKVIWFQNSSLYHFSMYHASHHIVPIPATEMEVEAEANAVKAIVETLCPLTIVLDGVVLTSTGVVLGCWQVFSGTGPITIRAKLRTALRRAPEKQLYDAAMLHTSFERLLGRPKTLLVEVDKTSEHKFFHELVTRLNNQIRGSQATVKELWYVEEYDVLALALNGRMEARKFQLGCLKHEASKV